ncbi:DUF3068 domain-containing protein [Janibacter sp. G56]|uniref:DUF3068 domain-containing protein n=1 Tax=Janibacter sp. G56 TaxID=3418717 RepID=UPI003D08F746
MTALLALVYVPGALKKTPLDVDSTTRLAGNASVLPTGEASPIKALSRTVSNGEKSDGDVVVFDTFTCLIADPEGDAPDCVDESDPDKRLVSATQETFATNRKSAVAVNDEKYIGDGVAHDGLVNKFPFDVEQKTYPFWDGVLAHTVDATFDGVEKIDGLETYRFVTDVANESAEISSGVKGTYSSLKTMFIDPVTGSIIKQSEKQSRSLEDGTKVLDMDLTFTDETVAANVKAAKDSGSQLGLLGKLPLITGLLGLLSGLAGFFLWRGARRQDEVDTYDYDRGYADTTTDRVSDVRNDADDTSLDVFNERADGDGTVRRSDLHRH